MAVDGIAALDPKRKYLSHLRKIFPLLSLKMLDNFAIVSGGKFDNEDCVAVWAEEMIGREKVSGTTTTNLVVVEMPHGYAHRSFPPTTAASALQVGAHLLPSLRRLL